MNHLCIAITLLSVLSWQIDAIPDAMQPVLDLHNQYRAIHHADPLI
jgi:hypothetical protein